MTTVRDQAAIIIYTLRVVLRDAILVSGVNILKEAISKYWYLAEISLSF